MSPKKHKYSEEFKLEAVRLCQAADRPLAEVAWELGVPPKKLVKWRARLGAIAANGAGTHFFDVSDPAKPLFVSRIKTRPFYRIGMDMWDVMVAGDYAFLGDTYNGVFVVDISDLEHPRFVGHRQLAPVPRTIDGLDTGERLPAPVGGIALAKDTLYVAGAWTDLHVVDATGLATTPEKGPECCIGDRRVYDAFVRRLNREDLIPLAVIRCG